MPRNRPRRIPQDLGEFRPRTTGFQRGAGDVGRSVGVGLAVGVQQTGLLGELRCRPVRGVNGVGERDRRQTGCADLQVVNGAVAHHRDIARRAVALPRRLGELLAARTAPSARDEGACRDGDHSDVHARPRGDRSGHLSSRIVLARHRGAVATGGHERRIVDRLQVGDFPRHRTHLQTPRAGRQQPGERITRRQQRHRGHPAPTRGRRLGTHRHRGQVPFDATLAEEVGQDPLFVVAERTKLRGHLVIDGR